MDNEALPEQHPSELPAPVGGETPVERAQIGAERMTNPEQRAAPIVQAAQAPPLPAIPPYDPAGAAQMPAPTQATTPSIADDADLIEKAWVDKAKAIVAQTRHDPYQQKKQISDFKAGYLKKRYNKDIKTS